MLNAFAELPHVRGREGGRMKNVIVVTGASGHIGHELAERLLSAGQTVRAVARGVEKLKPLGARGAEVRPGSFDDRAFLAGVFKGANGVFAMIPPNYSAKDVHAEQRKIAESIVAAIRESGVKNVVSLSSVGAELPDKTGPIAGLHVFEELLDKVAGLNVVHLRAAYFFENHLGSIGVIKNTGINGSAIKAEVPISMVATRDIAAVAADYLTKLDFKARNVRYILGARDYTLTEATRILGAAVGQPDLKYVQFPEADFKKGLVGAGFSASLADLFVEMSQGFNSGLIRGEPRSKANTTPTTLEDFAKTVFAPAFKAATSAQPASAR
jgi:uncharacterized protein YbjT (DUF2867 family)